MQNIIKSRGKTIRDSVHGDIFVPDDFMAIIDTPEFQRLRRIKQLSVANLLFPSADHTRFSHCLGTYFIMQKIISHFENELSNMNLEIQEREKQVALCAALLHDIGHGPFSHAFENILPGENVDHEKWTERIVISKDSSIYAVLTERFDENFPNDVAELIKKKPSIKKNGYKFNNVNHINLQFILSSLISSQLDADRMDYLLRDAFHTGVTLGKIDIYRLISSMTITVYNNNYYVCILEKYLSDIENYLLSRYQMHKNIYLHDFKCEMECVIKKIFNRALELFNSEDGYNVREDIPTALEIVFRGNDMEVKDYVTLDDTVLWGLFNKWKICDDYILSMLCSTLLERKKFNRIRILDNSEENIKSFKNELIEILRNHEYKINDLGEEYFWLEKSGAFKVYKNKNENIWISKNDGTVCDISEISSVITEKANRKSRMLLKGSKNMVAINYNLLKKNLEFSANETAIEQIKYLVKSYDNRNNIEIEKKYFVKDASLFNKVINVIEEYKKYEVNKTSDVFCQIDTYYDTDDKMLFNKNSTLRVRARDNNYRITIKTPTKAEILIGENDFNESIQSERFEHEIRIECEDIEKNKELVERYITEFKDISVWNKLKKVLTIINNRRKILLLKGKVKFEMVFDDVKYINPEGQQKHDYQIELELKSDYPHRVNLKLLTDYLEDQVPELEPTLKSKYKRGLELLNNS